MSKRFTATNKWTDPWFFELPSALKLLWLYINDACDHAGFWVVNKKVAEFNLGQPIDWESAEKTFEGKIIISQGFWFLKEFISFQYGRLRNNNSTHISVLKLLDERGFSEYAIGDGRELSPSKPKIAPFVRQRIFDEGEGQCIYCTTEILDFDFSVDHLVPFIVGGTNEISNLVLSCNSCNSYKSHYSLEEFIKRRNMDRKGIFGRLKALKKGLFSPSEGAKDKDKDKDKDVVKVVKGVVGGNEKSPGIPEQSKPYRIPEPTQEPVAALVMYYKADKKGVPHDDRNWDRDNFARCSKAASRLLEICGSYAEARNCMDEISRGFEEKGLDWTLETIKKWAYDWKKKSGGKDYGHSNRTRFYSSVARQRSERGLTEAREILTPGEIPLPVRDSQDVPPRTFRDFSAGGLRDAGSVGEIRETPVEGKAT